MLKNLTLAAFALAAVSAVAQDWNTSNMSRSDWSSWRMKYDTYAIANTDLNTISKFDQWRILNHEEKAMPAGQAYALESFFELASPDQERIVLKALTANFKQASMVRDEVAMARFGRSDGTYAWLSYPPLTWGANPGENSWASLPADTTTTTVVTTTPNTDTEIAMTDDVSRPMRIVMRHSGWRDIDYDQAVDILGAPLDDYDRGILHATFHPCVNDPTTYTNEAALDSIICVINQNAMMVDHLDRYAWYNHFDKDYYNYNTNWSW